MVQLGSFLNLIFETLDEGAYITAEGVFWKELSSDLFGHENSTCFKIRGGVKLPKVLGATSWKQLQLVSWNFLISISDNIKWGKFHKK